MSENLSFNSGKSNFAFIRALVFSHGKPGSNWFKATVGDSLVMIFFPDDKSITRDMIEPGDTIYIAGLQDMKGDNKSCTKKANCAPLVLQIDSFKNALKARQKNKEQAAIVEEKTIASADLQQNIDLTIDNSMKFCGTVVGAENVKFLKSKKEKHAKRGRNWGMHALNEIIELARKYEQ